MINLKQIFAYTFTIEILCSSSSRVCKCFSDFLVGLLSFYDALVELYGHMIGDTVLISGGWLLVASIVPNASLSGFQFSVETSYRGIGRNHANKSFILTTNAMKELRTHMPFTQLRFH